MKVAIMGFGVVGSGVGEILLKNAESIAKKTGEKIEVSRILDLREFPDSEYKCFTKEFGDILSDPEIETVAEVMGGVTPAYDFTKQLLSAGKNVVTSNKELVATHGTELFEIARKNGVNYMFEASVGGGIPVIKPLVSCLAANEITEISGILNGTTNYILTQMIKNGRSFDEALRGAQENGYAEKNPSADVDGIDTCRKIAILGSLAFGKYVDCTHIKTRGISGVTLEDVKYTDRLGYVIKLIGCARRENDGAYASVAPMLLPKSDPLAGIDDVFNGVKINGSFVGDVMFYGRGAGKLPTASAVVADIIDTLENRGKSLKMSWEDSEDGYLVTEDKRPAKYYLRVSGGSAPADAVSIGIDGEYAYITPAMTEAEADKYAAKLEEEKNMQIIRCFKVLQ